MGYGGLPNFTEFNAAGHVLLDGTLGRDVQDFRAYLSPWSEAGRAPRRWAGSRKRGDGVGVGVLERSHRRGRSGGCWRALAQARLQEAATAPSSGLRRLSRSRPSGPRCRDRHAPSGAVLATSAPVKG